MVILKQKSTGGLLKGIDPTLNFVSITKDPREAIVFPSNASAAAFLHVGRLKERDFDFITGVGMTHYQVQLDFKRDMTFDTERPNLGANSEAIAEGLIALETRARQLGLIMTRKSTLNIGSSIFYPEVGVVNIIEET